jgi:hypothetical protein
MLAVRRAALVAPRTTISRETSITLDGGGRRSQSGYVLRRMQIGNGDKVAVRFGSAPFRCPPTRDRLAAEAGR